LKSKHGDVILRNSVFKVKGLAFSTSARFSEETSEPPKKTGRKVLDKSALIKYFGATVVQFASINMFLFCLDYCIALLSEQALARKIIALLFFGFMSVKSRTFSFLDNSRPSSKSLKQRNREMKTPSWMPPPIAFPIIWSTIGVLRTISSFIVWERNSFTFLSFPIIMMMFHLSIGDTWNTINNVDKRPGAAVSGVLFVAASVYTTVFTYYQCVPLAGLILAPSAVWISVAAFLVVTLWKLNYDGPEQEPLFPYKVEESLN